MKRIFVISWFYPPINSSEGLVTFKLINNSKYKYDVFTQNNFYDWTYGSTVDYKNNKNVNVIFSESNCLKAWVEDAYQYFVKNKDKYDYIMTRAMPQESHLVGLRIKKDFPNVKWLASFGDPILHNPYHYINCSLYSMHSLKNPINKSRRKLYKLSPKRFLYNCAWECRHRFATKLRKELKQIQLETLKYADKIVLNNESQKKYMLQDNKKYLAKCHVIRHSYDSSFYPKASKKSHDKIRFVFVGHLDEIRNVDSLFCAINELNKSVEDLSKKAEFVFYGDMSIQNKVYIIDNQLTDIIKVEKPISYQESLNEMVNADWLIHTDGNISSVVDENIFFAAKIVDYFGSGTNILATTMQFGDVVDALRQANCLVLSYSCNEIKNWLYLIIYKNFKQELNKDFIKQFDAINVAKEFDTKVIGE